MIEMTLKITLVLLPGLNGTTGLFNPLIECIQDEFNVLPIAYPKQDKKTYQELASYVMARLAEINGKYIILGESFSGPLSLFLSDRKPDRLLGLVLVSTFIRSPNFRLGRFLPWTLGFSLTKPIYGVRFAISNKEDQSLISAISTEIQSVSPRVLSHRIEQIFSVNATESLLNCELPIVYFRGTKDYVVPKRNLREILSIKPDVQVVEFNARHFLLQSNSREAYREIRLFAAKIS